MYGRCHQNRSGGITGGMCLNSADECRLEKIVLAM